MMANLKMVCGTASANENGFMKNGNVEYEGEWENDLPVSEC
jgi:hypothetical protein